jgi:hypothetical protein
MVQAPLCNIGSLPSVQFASGIKIGNDAQAILTSAAAQIKASPACKICVVGHGGASKREQQLSWDRVESVINYLVEKQGISRDASYSNMAKKVMLTLLISRIAQVKKDQTWYQLRTTIP